MHQFLHWVYSNDGTVIDAQDNITLDSPQNLEALTALKDITAYAEEGPTSYEQNEVRAIFLDGKLGMIQASVGRQEPAEGRQVQVGRGAAAARTARQGPGHAADHRLTRRVQGHRRRGQGHRLRQVPHLAREPAESMRRRKA